MAEDQCTGIFQLATILSGEHEGTIVAVLNESGETCSCEFPSTEEALGLVVQIPRDRLRYWVDVQSVAGVVSEDGTAPPEPTLDDLLTACDMIEEGGAPPAICARLKALVRLGWKADEMLPVLAGIFREGGRIGPVPGISTSEQLIEFGIPSLIANFLRLAGRYDPTHPRDRPLRHDPTLRHELDCYSPLDQIRLAYDTEDIRWEYLSRRL